LRGLDEGSVLILSRFTQIGLLRLLTNASVMSDTALTLRQAWSVYDGWLGDPRVEFYPEPRNVDTAFRETTNPFSGKSGTKWVGDSYAEATHAKIATFDRAPSDFARKCGCGAIVPA
jgi:hypothetical protein